MSRVNREGVAHTTGALAALLWVSSCADQQEPSEPASLVEPERWVLADEDLDSFVSARPAEVDCDVERGLMYEQARFEINTAWCNYATVVQPALAPVAAGDHVEVRLWHGELTGGPATAYLGVALAGEVAWEREVAIPAESELIVETFPAPAALAVGEPIQFHVHNHGSNSWWIVSIDRL